MEAHLAVHGRGPRRPKSVAAVRASAQILEASAVPLLLLLLAGMRVMPLRVALWAGVWTSVPALGVFALLAARRTALSGWH